MRGNPVMAIFRRYVELSAAAQCSRIFRIYGPGGRVLRECIRRPLRRSARAGPRDHRAGIWLESACSLRTKAAIGLMQLMPGNRAHASS